MPLKTLPFLVLSVLWPFAAADAADFPKRQSGLWAFESPNNPFINGSLCVDDTNTNFMNTDVWSNFEQECEIINSLTDREQGELTSICRTAMTGEVTLAVTYYGDFKSRYRYAFIGLFTGTDGKEDKIGSLVRATYRGQCPASMKPGMRTLGPNPFDRGRSQD